MFIIKKITYSVWILNALKFDVKKLVSDIFLAHLYQCYKYCEGWKTILLYFYLLNKDDRYRGTSSTKL